MIPASQHTSQQHYAMYWMFSVTEKNWALGQRQKNTSQSSNNYNREYPPSKAIDGNPDGIFSHHSCSKTTADSSGHAWWSAIFEELLEVEAVVITNRGDCCGEL